MTVKTASDIKQHLDLLQHERVLALGTALRDGQVAGAHREEANAREARAAEAEAVARRERAQAEAHQSEAELHERGLADDRLDEDHARLTGDGEAGDTAAERRTR